MSSEESTSTGSHSATAAKAGIGFGTALAIAISWSANQSILWAIVHGLLSWIYVIYYAVRYQAGSDSFEVNSVTRITESRSTDAMKMS